MTTTLHTARGSASPVRSDWKDTLGRVGLVGKGVVFAVIGMLALQLASGESSDASQDGAIEWVASQPFGRFLLVALTISLFALAAWRLLDALVGDPVEGSEASDRAKFAVQGLLYLSLAAAALTTTVQNWSPGSTGSSSGTAGGNSSTASTVLDWPGGRWIVIAIGLGIIVYTAYTVKAHVVERTFLERMSVSRSSWIAGFGRFGYAARSVVYLLVGWFFVQAGITHDPDRAKGLSGALKELSGEGWGQLILWGVAFGLVAYGLFSVAEARYRRAA